MQPTRRLVSFFFRRQGSVHLACCPVFISSFPPAGSPSPDVDKAACFPHAVSFSLFFGRRGSVHLAHRLVFFLSFCPEALLLGDLQGSVHPTRCLFIFLFFIDGGGTRPHSGSFPPQKGGFFFFFPQLYHQWGWCMTRPPRSLRFPPFIGFFFFCSRVIAEGAAYNPPAIPSLVYPSEMGGFFFVLQLLNTQGQCITHTLPLVYPIPSYVLCVVNVLNEL